MHIYLTKAIYRIYTSRIGLS